MLLGGFIFDPEQVRRQIPIVQNPTEEEVECTIRKYACHDGIIGLSIVPEPDFGPIGLKLYIDSGNFLLMLSHYMEDGDIDVKTFHNECGGTEMIEILGDCYPEKSMTKDLNIICLCFQEFLRTGDVCDSSLKVT